MIDTLAPADAAVAAAVARGVTERQAAFITSLATERDLDVVATMDRATNRVEASRLIDDLLATPRQARTTAPRGTVEPVAEGYYAVEYLDVLRFYAIRAGRNPRIRFVNRFRSDELGPVSRTEAEAARAAIAADPAAASARFAAETVRCCKCARRLTDQESRDRGMGPDCASRA